MSCIKILRLAFLKRTNLKLLRIQVRSVNEWSYDVRTIVIWQLLIGQWFLETRKQNRKSIYMNPIKEQYF